MDSSRLQKRIALSRKLHILRALNTTSKSHLKLEAIKRKYSNLLVIKKEYLNLIRNFQSPKILHEVKVEKTEDGSFVVRVTCEKGEDTLVSILMAFEEMGLLVLQATVSCKDNSFSMEATTVAAAAQSQGQITLTVKDVTQAITKAIEKQPKNEMKFS